MRCMHNTKPRQIRRLHHSDVPELLDLISSVRQEFGLADRVAALLEPSDYAILDVYRHRLLREKWFSALKGPGWGDWSQPQRRLADAAHEPRNQLQVDRRIS